MTRLCAFFTTLALAIPSAPLRAQSMPPKIIDCHIHYGGDPAFLEKLVAKMDSVDGLAFLLTPPAAFEKARASIDKHGKRLVGFGQISLDDPHAIEQIDKFHAAGFRGLGELSCPLKSFDDRSYWPIYRRAEKYGMILLFHTGIVARSDPNIPNDVSSDRMRVTTLDLIAREFPKVTIIGAHLGNPEYAWAAEIGRWNPNLYFDMSGSSLIKKRDDYTFFKSIFWWSGVASPHTPNSAPSAFEKLVFGSDVFGGDLEEFDRELNRYHELLDACAVPHTAQEAIFSGTLWRMLQEKR